MTAAAPTPPGSLGAPIAPQDAQRYLAALQGWVDERRRELDALDQAILASPAAAALTPDIALALSVWQAVKVRLDALLTTWDSGRVGSQERERLSQLIWGRLDDDALTSIGPGAANAFGGLAVSLPEACRLSDALTAQLRTKLRVGPGIDQTAARIRELRAQLERLRDQAQLEPPENRPGVQAKIAQLAARTEDIAGKSERGGDIGGLLGPLEIDAVTFERDLIVTNQRRRQAAERLVGARALQARLVAREAELRRLVAATVASVTPSPKYAVPAVEALGPVPSGQDLDAYVARLTRVSAAMDTVERAYGSALAQLDQLRGQLEAQVAKAQAVGATGEDATTLADLTRQRLAARPVKVDVVRSLLATHAQEIDIASKERA